MRLVKIEDGLLEQDNFFVTSPSGDFLGEHIYSRTANSFILREGYIERFFPYSEYVIVVEKEGVQLDSNEAFYFYTRRNGLRSGLQEGEDDTKTLQPNKFWKLVRHNGFVQGYSSTDGVRWQHKGGGQADGQEVQGFSLDGVKPLTIRNYMVYRNPFIRLYNIPKDTKALLFDSVGNLISERLADDDGLVEIYLDNPLTGRLKLYNGTTFLYETPILDFKYGDVFFNTPYQLEVYYRGMLLDYIVTKLDTQKELVVIKNTSPYDTYTNLKVSVFHETVDEIKISLDDVGYENLVTIPILTPSEQKEVYIRIVKNPNYNNCGIRRFALEID